MIKKLEVYEETPSGYKHPENIIQEKINELVDAVNEIMTWRFETDEEPAENLQDPYAEQRKWIGKLCKFWDKNHEEERIYDILHHIDPNCVFKYCRRELGGGYQYCEPVKPDDDIIYKGE